MHPSIGLIEEVGLRIAFHSEIVGNLLDTQLLQLLGNDESDGVHEVGALHVVGQLDDIFQLVQTLLIRFWIVFDFRVETVLGWSLVSSDVGEHEVSGFFWEWNWQRLVDDRVCGFPVGVKDTHGSLDGRNLLDEVRVFQRNRLIGSLELELDLADWHD